MTTYLWLVEESATGPIHAARTDDGLVHGFRASDDGYATFPVCGAKSRAVDGIVITDIVCNRCLRQIVREVNPKLGKQLDREDRRKAKERR